MGGSSALKMEAVGLFETLVTFYETARCYITQDGTCNC
jgi:hypothetical protein